MITTAVMIMVVIIIAAKIMTDFPFLFNLCSFIAITVSILWIWIAAGWHITHGRRSFLFEGGCG